MFRVWLTILVLISISGCNRLQLIDRCNQQFQKQQSYISIYYISRYNVITYQVVSPKRCVLLAYHAVEYADGFYPQLAGLQIQDLALGQEHNVFITPSNVRSVTDKLPESALHRVKEYYTIKKAQESKFDCRFVSLPLASLGVKKVSTTGVPTVEGEIRNLQQDKGLKPLLKSGRSYFRIVMNPRSFLPVNEYYWSEDSSVVRYLLFTPDIQQELRALEKLRSLQDVQQLFNEKRVFDHLKLRKSG
ncbi:MAG TPA: hypothetical protein VEC37_10235 [Bacillota bacterium]|nr:hypothetical protein [Bacillota bacterium]